MANILAGTQTGIFVVEKGTPRRVLEVEDVRNIGLVGQKLFASTRSGAYRSDDQGESWVLSGISDRQVWQICSDNGSRLFAVTQPAGVFFSDDGGESWVEMKSFANQPQASEWTIPLTPPIAARARTIIIDPTDKSKMWVGIEVGGIAKTEDGGASWDVVLPGGNPDLHVLCADPDQPNILYASTGYGRLDGVAEMIEGNAGVFRSDDGGSTWKYAWRGITPRYARPMCIDPRAPHQLTVACAPTAFSSFEDEGGADAMLLTSDDGGESWGSLCDQAHSPSPANIHGLVVDSEILGGVIVGMDNGQVWRVQQDSRWEMLAENLPPVLSVASF